MINYFDTLISSGSIWVHFAALFYVLGFAVRDQLVLRILMLGGTVCYAVYYWLVATVPLWDAIAWTLLMGVVNCYILIQILKDRTTFRMSEEAKTLYKVFEAINPGEFRKILKLAEWRNLDELQVLTQEGEENDKLFFLVSGDLEVIKAGSKIRLAQPSFVGELSYLLRQKASATVQASSKARIATWHHDALRQLEKKHPAIRIALRETLNHDIANKLYKSAS